MHLGERHESLPRLHDLGTRHSGRYLNEHVGDLLRELSRGEHITQVIVVSRSNDRLCFRRSGHLRLHQSRRKVIEDAHSECLQTAIPFHHLELHARPTYERLLIISKYGRMHEYVLAAIIGCNESKSPRSIKSHNRARSHHFSLSRSNNNTVYRTTAIPCGPRLHLPSHSPAARTHAQTHTTADSV
jgi:hypothetical protein